MKPERALVLLLLVSPVSGQLPTETVLPDFRVGGPSGAATGSSTQRMVAFDFDADFQRDVALLHGTQVDVMVGTGEFQALMSDVATANDIAVAREANVDRLLVANADGLSYVDYDVQNETWDETSIESDDWEGAKIVLVGDPAGYTAGTYVYGLMSDSRTFRRLSYDGSAWVDFELPITMSADVNDFVLLDWNGDGDQDIALATATTLYVYISSRSAPVPSSELPDLWTEDFAGSSPGFTMGAIAAGSTEGSADWLAYVVKLTTYQWLVTADQNGVNAAVPFPSAQSETMSSGPLDFDGSAPEASSDLVVSLLDDHKLVALGWHDSDTGTTPFDFLGEGATPAHYEWDGASVLDLLGVGTPNPQAHRRPLVADLDNDSDNDICYASGDDPWTLEVFKNPAIDAGSKTPVLFGDEEDISVTPQFQALLDVDEGTPPGFIQAATAAYANRVVYTKEEPEPFHEVSYRYVVGHEGMPASANALQVQIWRQTNILNGSTLIPFGDFFWELEEESPGEYTPTSVKLVLHLSHAGTESANLLDSDVYYIRQRYVVADEPLGQGTPVVVDAFPSALWGLSLDGEVNDPYPPIAPAEDYPPHYRELRDYGTSTYVHLESYIEVTNGAGTITNGDRIGASVPIPLVPSYPTNLAPIWRASGE